MKKVIVSLALIMTSALSNVQVLKNNFLSGCKKGQPIEKASYSDKKSPINKEKNAGTLTFILACKSPQKDKTQFGVGIYKTREISPQDYDLKTTHLII